MTRMIHQGALTFGTNQCPIPMY